MTKLQSHPFPLTKIMKAAGTTLALLSGLAANAASDSSIDLVIKVRGRISMQQLAAQAVAQGVTYTPQQIRQLAAPSDEQYAALIQQLKQEGFQIEKESATHLFVTVRAQKAQVERSFQTQLAETSKGRKALVAPRVPTYLSLVDSVIGLNNTRKLRPRLKVHSIRPLQDASSPGGKSPAEIKKVYDLDAIYQAGITGKGQDIAIATYDNFKIDDVKAYYQKVGLPSQPNIDQKSTSGEAQYKPDSAMETELDAEFSGMIAPGANIHVYTSAANSDEGELELFTAILDDNVSKIVNYSWGSCEAELDPSHKSAMDEIYARAVAQGVNITVASGDSGSAGCTDQPDTTSADYPASNPNVVAVGGTTLVESSSALEVAWSGSGGGISALYPLPDYQKGLGQAFTKRSMPDVAFNADPKTGEAAWEYAVDQFGQVSSSPEWVVIGGTSIAAPQWAGFLALVNEARVQKGLSTLGFLNPIIYGLDANQRAGAFNDVTQGSNGDYSCQPGFDAVTGFGSMKGQSLFSILSQK